MRRLIFKDELRTKGIRYSDTQRWRKIRAGQFPKPIAGAGRQHAWLEDEIDEYIEDLRKAENP